MHSVLTLSNESPSDRSGLSSLSSSSSVSNTRRHSCPSQGCQLVSKRRKRNNNEGDVCAICLTVMRPSEASAIDSCRHRFHWDCIEAWSKIKNECPLCKRRFNRIKSRFKSSKVRLLSDADGANKSSDSSSYEWPAPSEWFSGQWYLDTMMCESCGLGDNEEVLLLCDGCDAAMHTYCLGLDSIPEYDWYCDRCEALGLNPDRITSDHPRASSIIHHSNDGDTQSSQQSTDHNHQNSSVSPVSTSNENNNDESSVDVNGDRDESSDDHRRNNDEQHSEDESEDDDEEEESVLSSDDNSEEDSFDDHRKRPHCSRHQASLTQLYEPPSNKALLSANSVRRTPIMTRSRAKRRRDQWEHAAQRPSSLTVFAEQHTVLDSPLKSNVNPSTRVAMTSSVDRGPAKKTRRTSLDSRQVSGLSALF